MTPTELVIHVNQTWKETIPAHRISAMRRLRGFLEPELLSLFDATLDGLLANVQDAPNAIAVAAIHGIRTDARWHEMLRAELKGMQNVNVVPLGYGWISAIKLWGPFREGPILEIERKLRELRDEEPTATLVVIAHSFGTYITSKILLKSAGVRINRLILCGSIVSRTFPWGSIPERHMPAIIVNDVGARDWFPVLATITTYGYGPSGSLGFRHPKVSDRFFAAGHSDLFNSEHIQKYWLPVIKGEPPPVPEWESIRSSAPYFMQLGSALPAALLWLPLLAAALWSWGLLVLAGGLVVWLVYWLRAK